MKCSNQGQQFVEAGIESLPLEQVFQNDQRPVCLQPQLTTKDPHITLYLSLSLALVCMLAATACFWSSSVWAFSAVSSWADLIAWVIKRLCLRRDTSRNCSTALISSHVKRLYFYSRSSLLPLPSVFSHSRCRTIEQRFEGTRVQYNSFLNQSRLFTECQCVFKVNLSRPEGLRLKCGFDLYHSNLSVSDVPVEMSC